jgi:hypothetical protein
MGRHYLPIDCSGLNRLAAIADSGLAAVGVVCSVVSVPSAVVSPARPSVADAIGTALGVGLDNAAVVADRESGCVGTGKKWVSLKSF